MLPVERQNHIKELIYKHHSLKISILSEKLGVSEMTIHRDLKPLIREGIVTKTFGGIMLANQTPRKTNADKCIFCSRKINERMAFRIIRPDNQVENACCPHCGLLRYGQIKEENVQAICADFFRQTTISAKLAWYIMDTSIQIGCCQPQILAFEWKEHAEKFVKGFGGRIYSFHEAVEHIKNVMSEERNEGCCNYHNLK